MSTEQKKALLGFGLGFLILYGMLKLFKKKEVIQTAEVNEAGITVAVTAYKEALSDQVDLATLNELNETLMREYGVRVGQKSDGTYSVLNNEGKEIRVVA